MESAWLAGQIFYLHQGIFLLLIPHSQFLFPKHLGAHHANEYLHD